MWRNWAGNQTMAPAAVRHPATVDEVAQIVKEAAATGQRVKAIGSGHSFTGIGLTDGVLLQLDRLDRLIEADPATGRVVVQAGLPLRRLNTLLAERGLGLTNLGDIDVQTVAGAISTGTHGTGRDSGALATQVVGLEIVLADGSVVPCSADEQPDLFETARVSLGALGVVTAVTLQAEPAFLLTADERPMRMDEVLANGLFGLTCWSARKAPRIVPALNKMASRTLAPRTYTDAAPRVFTSPRRVRFVEMEYALPRAAVVDVLRELRNLPQAQGVSFPVEVRVAPADDVPLSTAYGRDSAYVAVHVFRGDPYRAYFDAVEAIVQDVEGRPHWGKLHTLDAERLRTRYPRFDDVVALRDRVDPERRFGNDYLERVLG